MRCQNSSRRLARRRGCSGQRSDALARISARLEGLSAQVRERFSPPHIRATPFKHAHNALAAAAIDGLGLDDRGLPARQVMGAPVAGDLPCVGAWDPAWKPRPLGLDFHDLPHAQWNAWLASDVEKRACATPAGAANAEAVFRRTRKEIDDGLAFGPVLESDLSRWYGPDGWRAMRRFGVEQGPPSARRWVPAAALDAAASARAARAPWIGGDALADAIRCSPDLSKEQVAALGLGDVSDARTMVDGATWHTAPPLRAVDDASEALFNDASNQRDKLRCQRADLPTRCAVRFQRHVRRLGRGRASDGRGWSLQHGCDDLDAAYRRVLVDEPQFTVVAIWDPDRQCVAYVIHYGYNFGLVAAVLCFNAVPALASAIARRILGSPTDHYYDDFNTTCLDFVGDACQRALARLCEDLGYPLSVVKRLLMNAIRQFLGVITDFTRLAEEGVVQLYVSEERKVRLDGLLADALVQLRPLQAASLCGKLLFTLTWAFGRVGRAAMQPLQRRAASEDHWAGAPSAAIRRAVGFLRDVVASAPPLEVCLDEDERPPLVVWSDARYEPDAAQPAGGGWIVYVPPEGDAPERVICALEDSAPELMAAFVQGHKQYIGQLELAYAVSPSWTLPAIFAGRRVLHFIDNQGACAGLIKGYSKAVDCGRIVNAFHAFNTGLRADTYFEYVRSEANVADLPSRGGVAELHAILKRMGWVPEWVKCRLPPLGTWDAAAGEWLRRGSALATHRHGTIGRRVPTQACDAAIAAAITKPPRGKRGGRQAAHTGVARKRARRAASGS